jgi:hypothetical protein
MTPEELNAAVAEHVMGWSHEDAERGYWLSQGCISDPLARALPEYSADIAAAWQVVEKLLPLLGHIYPACDPETGKLLHWCAVVEDGPRRRGYTAPTAPEAICRAALAAVQKGGA